MPGMRRMQDELLLDKNMVNYVLIQVEHPFSKMHGTRSVSSFRFFPILEYLHENN
jgi:hypothetical protein